LANLPELPAADRKAARYAFLARLAGSNHVLVRTHESRRAALAALRLDPARAAADPNVRGPLLRSFLPQALLRRRRPGK
jgi:hypothetical protein